MLAFLARTDARAVARATLDPLTEYDRENGTALLETTRTWLEHGGQFDATAQELGVHRHTVRSRIALAERLLGRDLSGFHAAPTCGRRCSRRTRSALARRTQRTRAGQNAAPGCGSPPDPIL